MRAQLHTDQLTTWAADNAAIDGIADLGNLLQQGKLLVTDRCRMFLTGGHRLRVGSEEPQAQRPR